MFSEVSDLKPTSTSIDPLRCVRARRSRWNDEARMVRGEPALNDEIRMTKLSGVIECHVALGMAWSLPFQFRKELEPAARQSSAYLVCFVG